MSEKIEHLLTELLTEIKIMRYQLEPKKAERTNSKSESIPYQKIVELYNQTCTSLKGCEVINDKRKRAIRSLSKQYLPNLENWQQYFQACNQDSWFNGINHQASIDTILSEPKVIRMFEQGPRP